jgi:tripartite-type tricarboxylate transporter receptor subunit TctC
MNIASIRRLMLQAAAAALLPLAVQAQPDKPLEWVVGYAAGGGSDYVARSVAVAMSGELGGRGIIINNKPGAATNIAADYVAKSKDYGNIMLTADFATLAANPSLFSKLPYNPDGDFQMVGLLARFPMLLVVGPNVPAKNLKEFLAWAKTKADPIPYASAGTGSPHHLMGELFRQKAGLKLQHVPYRGAAPAVQDLVGGQIPIGFMDSASVLQYIASGRLRAIGVASKQRVSTMADIPTFEEQGLKDVEAHAWQGLVVPSGTPADVVTRLNKALVAALNATPVKARLQTMALEPMPGTPQQMTDYARAERIRWARIIREANIKLD